MKSSDITEDRLDWYRDAKLGMFIHWGPYSVAGVEASWPIMAPEWAWLGGSRRISQKKYELLSNRFNPSEFDADEWVRAALGAGMRYIVFTAKHHDGFCMFDAPGTNYKITNTAFGRDIVAELADACHGCGMQFGLYYSPPDMHHTGYRDTSVPARSNWQGQPERAEWEGYLDYMEEHLRALLTRYGHISLIWFDGLFEQQKYNPTRFHNLIKELSPTTLINDRLGDNGDYITPEQGIPDGIPVKEKAGFVPQQLDGDFFAKLMRALRTPILRRIVRRKMRKLSDEQRPLSPVPTEILPAKENFRQWETCMTMNRTWAYCPTDRDWKSGSKLIHSLVEVASRGGNLLLNVGPKPDGTFPAEALDRLEEVGGWMGAHGESVYGSTYGSTQGDGAVRTTERNGAAYVVVVKIPDDSLVRFSAGRSVSSARVLATNEELGFQSRDGRIEIDISRAMKREVIQPMVIKLL